MPRAAHGRLPAIQSVQKSMLRSAPAGISLPFAMSANCRRSPGFRTRMTSAKTRRLSAHRLMTPLLITTSAESSRAASPQSRLAGTRHCADPSRPRGRPTEQFLRHVAAHDAAFRPDLTGVMKQSKPSPEPRSTTRSPGFNVPSENGLPTPQKPRRSTRRSRGARERPSGVEVIAAVRIDRDGRDIWL
jgi:hypothetical protein